MKHNEATFEGAESLELYCQTWRPEEGTRAVLVVVHGFGEHSGRYTNVVDSLVPGGFAVYSFDLRGHGRSPGQRGHINAWAEYREDLRAFLQWVRSHEPKSPIFLMGYSLGGLIVLEFVLRGQEDFTGVVVSGPILIQPEIPRLLMALSRILSHILPRLSMDSRLDASTISRDSAVVRAYRDDPLVHSKGSPRLATEMSKAIAWTQAHASEWQLPLLILHGKADRLVPAEGSRVFYEKVAFPDKERHEYEGGYHEPHSDIHHEQVLKDVMRWVERHL